MMKQNGSFKMNIPDVNVLSELRHFVEQNSWCDEYQLNPRLCQCRLEIFVSLCKKLEGNELQFDDDAKKKLKEFAKCNQQEESFIEKILSGSLEDGLKGLAKAGTKVIITEVLKLIPFGGIAADAVDALVDVISKSRSYCANYGN